MNIMAIQYTDGFVAQPVGPRVVVVGQGGTHAEVTAGDWAAT